MANTYFQFKQFTIHQDHCAMKVSTDAVVLGALAKHASPNSILDIGSGTGVITLMLAQRFPEATVQGIELDEAAASQSRRNVQKSPWPGRVEIKCMRFQAFEKESTENYPLIVSNPPYFPKHHKSADLQRNLALHNDELSFGDLIKGVVKRLDKNGGFFWVILPPQQMKELDKIARFFGLHAQEWYELKDRPSTKTLRHIKSFSFNAKPSPEMNTICIKNEEDRKSVV